MPVARMACIHTYLECLQRQFLELEQSLKEGPFSNSRTMSKSVANIAHPKMFSHINVKILESLEVSSQFVKCIVPLAFVISLGDANVKVYTS